MPTAAPLVPSLGDSGSSHNVRRPANVSRDRHKRVRRQRIGTVVSIG